LRGFSTRGWESEALSAVNPADQGGAEEEENESKGEHFQETGRHFRKPYPRQNGPSLHPRSGRFFRRRLNRRLLIEIGAHPPSDKTGRASFCYIQA
jgi:hypothetical protein